MKTEKLETLIATPAVTVIRTVAQIGEMFTFGADGQATLKKGASPLPEEIALYAAEGSKQAESTMLRSANVLRSARNLPAVKVKDGEEEVEIPAFDAVKIHFRRMAATDGAFYNMLQMVGAIDTTEQLKLPVSPFVVKEAAGVLRKAGVLDGEADKGTLKLKSGGNAETKALVTALKSGTAKVNSVRPLVAAVKAKQTPTRKPKTESKKTMLEKYKPEIVARDAKSLIGIWEKAVSVYKVEEVRTAAKADIAILAKLAGLTAADLK